MGTANKWLFITKAIGSWTETEDWKHPDYFLNVHTESKASLQGQSRFSSVKHLHFSFIGKK